jgi:hypothetical protein
MGNMVAASGTARCPIGEKTVGTGQEAVSMVLSMPPFLWCVLTIVLFPYTERVLARAISGHRTEAVFERYNITDDADLGDAGLKQKPMSQLSPRIRPHALGRCRVRS